ncbi:MAG TPA: prepilin-type N-terminal cleavage/methylation domain-containing protein [Thermoanaerobaculia bacterium]
MPRRRGFTLIELLVVVAIIGIIAAIAIVNMINAIQRAKQKRSMGDMKTIATAIEAYATDHNFYPAAAAIALPSGLSLPTTTIGTISGSINPTYIRAVPLVDGWNSFFLYGASASKSDFAVLSTGADGVPETSPVGGATTNFNADIIIVDGTFVQFPDGAQQ